MINALRKQFEEPMSKQERGNKSVDYYRLMFMISKPPVHECNECGFIYNLWTCDLATFLKHERFHKRKLGTVSKMERIVWLLDSI